MGGDTKGWKMDSGPLGRGSEYRTADFVESKAGALKPKHCETESLTQYRKREEEEEGGPKWGRGNFLWPDAIGDHPAFYARDAALGWRLCHSRLEGAFSHKGANRKNVSSPRLHSSEK